MTNKYRGLSFDQRIDEAFAIFAAPYVPPSEEECQVTMKIMRILVDSRYARYHKNDQKSPESQVNTKEVSADDSTS